MKINYNTIIGDFNTHLHQWTDHLDKKINKETVVLNNILDQLDFTDKYRTFHPKTAEYTFFSSAHVPFSRIDHMLGHKTSFNKFKRIKILTSIFTTTKAETRNQLQDEKWEKHKHMEIKQHAIF